LHIGGGMIGPDWEHLSTFVAVADSGSLTGGAERLGISQPTASRHIQALEEALELILFVRHPRGLTLTDRGAELFTAAREVAERVDALFLRARGAPAALAGAVRISATGPIGVHAMAPSLAALRAELPEITVELTIDDRPTNLSRREADMAARMFRPSQPELVVEHLGELEVGMFARRDYLERQGLPERIEGSSGHTWIGSDRDPTWHRLIGQLGVQARYFGYRCDNPLAQIQAIGEGVGIGTMHAALAARDNRLVRVLPDLAIAPDEMWLVMHRELRGNAGIRTVFDRLADALREYARTTGPEPYC